ncbi:4'-phosphopantetheinyl transferase superfamily protein [Streptomyces sp. NPDC005820]|uniref:4'-phosphopantetheinyl transferase family protein n=1 Tax=Streptomyces sp. NPDC005820 TaxID=3157069 RepID=UPI0033C056CA
MAHAVESRRREFTTVRHCARTALARFGFAGPPLLPGRSGAPRWPDGIVGSMTHRAGYRAAAVARVRHTAALGIDAEPDLPLPAGMPEAVSLHEERARMPQLRAAVPSVAWDRLLFSAKEAVYKVWFPLTGRLLDFPEADIVFAVPPSGVRQGTFRARLLVPGRWSAGGRSPCSRDAGRRPADCSPPPLSSLSRRRPSAGRARPSSRPPTCCRSASDGRPRSGG